MSHLYVPNAGNLLDYASATLDTSVGFWTGSASTRAVNTSDPYAGAGCLEATATGSAQFYVSASKTVQVTPGSGTDGIAAPVVKFDGTVGAMTFNSPAGGHMALSAGIKAYAGAYLSAVFPVRTAIPTSLPGTQATAPV